MRENIDYLEKTDYSKMDFSNLFWNNFRKNASQKRIPIHGHFELTPKCNFDCKMCYIHSKINKVIKEKLSFFDWVKIIDEAIEAGMVFASLSGGECLLSPYFDKIYLYLKQKGILVFILTNGFLLNEKMALFSEYPPALIQVSVYGWDDNSYEKVTGRRVYEKVNKNIILAKKCGLPISIAVTASRYLTSIYNIVKYFYKLNISVNVNKWLIPPYKSTGRCLEDINLSPEKQINIELEFLKATNQKINKPYNGKLPSTGSSNMIRHYGLTCAAGRTDFSINWKGEMCPCVSIPVTTGYPLIESFFKAWKKTINFADEFELPIECFECEYRFVCKRCPAFHLSTGKVGHCNTKACVECKMLVQKGIIKLKKEDD